MAKYIYGTCRGTKARKDRSGNVELLYDDMEWIPCYPSWKHQFQSYDIQPEVKLSWYEKFEVWAVVIGLILSAGAIILFINIVK